MGRYDGNNIEEVAARTMALFYLFDKSGSMFGTKIGQVNNAMKDIPKIIKEVADGAPNANIGVAAAAFSMLSNTPKTAVPRPVMRAPSAPAPSSADFILSTESGTVHSSAL